MVLILAFSIQDQVEKYGAYVGLAAFIGLAVLSLLYFAQARELKRLRDWAGRAPERAQELEARVVAQAEEALREPELEPSGTVGPAVPVAKPAAAPASGNGRQAGTPAPIPMGPRPAIAVAALAAQTETAQATVEVPAVPAGTDGDEAPEEEAVAAEPAGADGRTPAPPAEEEPAPPAADEEEEEQAAEPVRSGNGVPAGPPTQIPRATPRPQPRPAPAAPLRASPPARAASLPPRRGVRRPARVEGGSRAGIYTLIGILVLAIAIFVPVYFTVLSGEDEAPPPNPIAEPSGGTANSGGAGARAAEARPEKVVVVLNGTPVNDLAARYRDELLGAGYSDEQGMIRVGNSVDQSRQDSVVYYDPAERRQARDVARVLDISRIEEIDVETQALADDSDETGSLPADVTVVLGADKAP
jgi:LytR cell envelope-related transcriptional attenuator